MSSHDGGINPAPQGKKKTETNYTVSLVAMAPLAARGCLPIKPIPVHRAPPPSKPQHTTTNRCCTTEIKNNGGDHLALPLLIP